MGAVVKYWGNNCGQGEGVREHKQQGDARLYRSRKEIRFLYISNSYHLVTPRVSGFCCGVDKKI